MQRYRLHHSLLAMALAGLSRMHAMADGDGGGTDVIEVDTDGGVKVKIPRADAAKLITARDARKAKERATEEELGRFRAQVEAESAKARKAEEDKLAVELGKKGEVDKVRELMTAEHRKQIDSLAGMMAGDRVRAALASHPKILPAVIDDALALLKSRVRFDVASNSLIVLNEAGQPQTDKAGAAVKVDAFVADWLAERPHYLRDATPSGSGAEGSARTPSRSDGRGTITRAQYDEYTKIAKHDQVAADAIKAIGKGKLKIVDE